MKFAEARPTCDYLCNYWINRIPFVKVRMAAYRYLGVSIGQNSTILMNVEFQHARDVQIGSNTIINPHSHLDGRGGLRIGNNVNISPHVLLVAGMHDLADSESFKGASTPILIEDYVWLCTRSTILPGVTVGRGAVVAAGAVVTCSVEAYAVVAGVPARRIGDRPRDLSYCLSYSVSWQ